MKQFFTTELKAELASYRDMFLFRCYWLREWLRGRV